MSLVDLGCFEMQRAATLDALCALVAKRHEASLPTILLAGGTDWMVEQEMGRVQSPDAPRPLVVDIAAMGELRGITRQGDTLRIGAAATYAEIGRSAAIQERAPLLCRMASDIGAVQIQARGTLGGNLATASPAADGVAALAAYDATIVVRSVRGERRIAFGDLQTGYKRSTRAPDEVIVAIEIALPAVFSPWIWRKVGTRRAQAISKVALAGVAEIEDGRVTRIGFGMASVAAVTAIMPKTRALFTSGPLASITRESLDNAVTADVHPIDDIRSTGEYRAHCAKAVTRAFARALGADV